MEKLTEKDKERGGRHWRIKTRKEGVITEAEEHRPWSAWLTLQRKSHLWIPFLKIVRPQSWFPHSFVWERTYSQDRFTYFTATEYADRSWGYINRSQTHECGNWDCGRAISFLEVVVSNFWYCVFAVQRGRLGLYCDGSLDVCPFQATLAGAAQLLASLYSSCWYTPHIVVVLKHPSLSRVADRPITLGGPCFFSVCDHGVRNG